MSNSLIICRPLPTKCGQAAVSVFPCLLLVQFIFAAAATVGLTLSNLVHAVEVSIDLSYFVG
jgi:hypothetical protein